MSPHFRAAGLSPEAEAPERRLRMNFAAASIILQDGRSIGMFKVDRTAQPWRLVQILLASEAQGRGMGTALLCPLIAEAESCRATVALSVLKGNPAKRLYERLGFETVGEEPHAWNMQRAPGRQAVSTQP